ncbi:MAG: hypothetical protein ABEJ89_04515, partial [Haloarculaceae archaeon]
MEGVPENAIEVFNYLMDDLLAGIELHPSERQGMMAYMNERHSSLYGLFTTYFVLGSYDSPFKWRLETVADQLNNRLGAYAYLLAPQPDPDIGSDDLVSDDDPDFPELKLKYYINALYADHIVLIVEHNYGGDLTELGRTNLVTFFDRTRLLPRGWQTTLPDDIEDTDDVRVLAFQAVYDCPTTSMLKDRLDEIADDATAADLPVTGADLE